MSFSALFASYLFVHACCARHGAGAARGTSRRTRAGSELQRGCLVQVTWQEPPANSRDEPPHLNREAETETCNGFVLNHGGS